jgi:hypothetical protein
MATRAVGIVWAAHQLGTGSDRQLRNALVPAFDDLSFADHKFEGFAAGPRRIELLAVVQGADVVDHHGLAGFWVGATWTEECMNEICLLTLFSLRGYQSPSLDGRGREEKNGDENFGLLIFFCRHNFHSKPIDFR